MDKTKTEEGTLDEENGPKGEITDETAEQPERPRPSSRLSNGIMFISIP
jgi:hypothetical protein